MPIPHKTCLFQTQPITPSGCQKKDLLLRLRNAHKSNPAKAHLFSHTLYLFPGEARPKNGTPWTWEPHQPSCTHGTAVFTTVPFTSVEYMHLSRLCVAYSGMLAFPFATADKGKHLGQAFCLVGWRQRFLQILISPNNTGQGKAVSLLTIYSEACIQSIAWLIYNLQNGLHTIYSKAYVQSRARPAYNLQQVMCKGFV